ncbi:MAG TPA: hypothetical protein VFH58_08835 [Acidimicrobiales bacterium]|nr:hypothetical protein [Acidimicrobiales bacterium]
MAATADRVASDQRAIARQARTMQRQRDRGWSWSQILDRQHSPGIVELLRTSRRHLSTATASLTSALAQALSSEGQTRRQIARHLGVTHQRVTAVLRHGRRSDGS